MRRVVVTGMGAVTPLGVGVEHVWRRLLNGESGIATIQSYEPNDLACQIAGHVPVGEMADGAFKIDDWVDRKDQRKMDPFIAFAIAAADEAIADSGWVAKDDESREMSGVLIGSGIGGLPGISETSVTLHERGPRRVSPFFICLLYTSPSPRD